MNTKKGINTLRRKLMRSLTQNIGSSSFSGTGGQDNIRIASILVSRPNRRLGNLLLITPLLQEIEAVFPACKVDLLVQGNVADSLFQQYRSIHRILKLPGNPFKHPFKYAGAWLAIRKNRYDLVINVARTSSSGRLSTKIARGRHKIFGETDPAYLSKFPDQGHIAKYPVYVFRDYLSRVGFQRPDSPVPALDLKLTPTEKAAGRKIVNDLTNNNGKKTIALFTFATGDKCYSKTWWETTWERLKHDYPEYNFIEILPVQNVSQLSFSIPAFYSRDIREIGAVIASTDLFIGADSGIMHIAQAVHTPTIGLFCVTDEKGYHPYGSGSIAINTNQGDLDQWMRMIDEVLPHSVRN
jgi:ADP-heptose:LPS heptosyltransferase